MGTASQYLARFDLFVYFPFCVGSLITSIHSLLLISHLSFFNQLVRYASPGKFVTVFLRAGGSVNDDGNLVLINSFSFFIKQNQLFFSFVCVGYTFSFQYSLQ